MGRNVKLITHLHVRSFLQPSHRVLCVIDSRLGTVQWHLYTYSLGDRRA
jgi:hypothetical protein